MTFQLVDAVFFEFVPARREDGQQDFSVLVSCVDAITLGNVDPIARVGYAVTEATRAYGHADGSWRVLERRMFERRESFEAFNSIDGPITQRVLELTKARRG